MLSAAQILTTPLAERRRGGGEWKFSGAKKRGSVGARQGTREKGKGRREEEEWKGEEGEETGTREKGMEVPNQCDPSGRMR